MERKVEIDLMDFALAREFVKRELKERGYIDVEKLKKAAPEDFTDPDLLLLLMVHGVSEVVDELGIEYLEFDDTNRHIAVLKPEEYDPDEYGHITAEELKELVNSILARR